MAYHACVTLFPRAVLAATLLAVAAAQSLAQQPAHALSERDLQDFWLDLYPAEADQAPARASDDNVMLLAKAVPDECFIGIGADNLYPFDFDLQTCSDGVPKTNESYVFGLAKAGPELWFGTAPNMGCLVYGTIADQGFPLGLPGPRPVHPEAG